MLIKGIIIENSLANLDTFSQLQIDKTWKEGDWTLHTVSATHAQLPDLARCLKDGPWYMHFWDEDEVIVLYKTRTFRALHADPESFMEAISYGKSIGIPEEQLKFPVE